MSDRDCARITAPAVGAVVLLIVVASVGCRSLATWVGVPEAETVIAASWSGNPASEHHGPAWLSLRDMSSSTLDPFEIEARVARALRAGGWSLTNDPDAAGCWLECVLHYFGPSHQLPDDPGRWPHVDELRYRDGGGGSWREEFVLLFEVEVSRGPAASPAASPTASPTASPPASPTPSSTASDDEPGGDLPTPHHRVRFGSFARRLVLHEAEAWDLLSGRLLGTVAAAIGGEGGAIDAGGSEHQVVADRHEGGVDQ